MRKIALVGIFVVLLGAVLVSFSAYMSMQESSGYDALIVRPLMIVGFVMMLGGGLISLSPFGSR